MAEEQMEPWVPNLLEDLNRISRENVFELRSIINRMGMEEKNRSEWMSILKEQVVDTYSSLLDDARTFESKLIDSIEELLKQASELCKQLQIKMPLYGSGNLSLSEEKTLLKSRVTEYEDKVKSRMNELNGLRKRQSEACKSLGREPISISESPLPSMEEVDKLAQYVEKLEDEKFKRESKFIDVKCKILDIVQELGIQPSLEIEKTVCSPDDSLFLVTDYNMKWIDEYHESLKQQKNQTANEITNLREKLGLLWEMLSEDIRSTNEFLEKHTGNSLGTLEALQLEVKRCENLKKANIEKFVKKMRDELDSLWIKCHTTAVEREKFEYFHDNLYTEDLLTFHDMQVETMKKYYDDNKEILTMLESREEYWKRKIELEEKAKDPNRYKNRGGTLLKEEKERNGVTKRIKDMEVELLLFAQRYEEDNGKPFLSWGRTIADIIEKTHDDYENDKKQQLSVKKQQRNLTPTPGKSGFLGSTLSASRKNLLTLTPSATPGSQKRKLPPTSLFSSQKKKTPAAGHSKQIPKIQLNNETIEKNKKRARYSLERKRRLDKIRRVSRMIEQKKRAADETMDYEGFEKEMQVKDSCRSTLFNGGASCSAALATPLPQTPSHTRTPQKRRLPPRTNTFTKLRTVPGSKMDI